MKIGVEEFWKKIFQPIRSFFVLLDQLQSTLMRFLTLRYAFASLLCRPRAAYSFSGPPSAKAYGVGRGASSAATKAERLRRTRRFEMTLNLEPRTMNPSFAEATAGKALNTDATVSTG